MANPRIFLSTFGQPAGAQVLYCETAVEHFGKAQCTGNDTYHLRLGLIRPETEPNDSTLILLFVGEETPIEIWTTTQWLPLDQATDPSYDLHGYAKVATIAASSEMGSAAACPENVQNFFKNLFALAKNSSGLDQINTDVKLCPDSLVKTYDQAQYNAPVAVNNIPANRVSAACEHLSNSSLAGTDLLAAMTQAIEVFSQNSSSSCLDTTKAASAGLNSAAGPPEPIEEEPAPEAAGEPELSATQKFGCQICTRDTTPASHNGDMFYEAPYSVQAEDEAGVMQFDARSTLVWVR
ncbi:hypothetical protein WJX77_002934 [Trebouxia sp. C0004]